MPLCYIIRTMPTLLLILIHTYKPLTISRAIVHGTNMMMGNGTVCLCNMNVFIHYRNEKRNICDKRSFPGLPILKSSQQTEKQSNSDAPNMLFYRLFELPLNVVTHGFTPYELYQKRTNSSEGLIKQNQLLMHVETKR